MSADELKLDALEIQATELRTTRNTLFDQIKKLKEERDRHNKTSKGSRDQAQKHRTERDRINKKIQEIKQKLGPLFDTLNEKNNALDEADRVIRAEYRGKPRKETVQKDLERIEWEVMTTPTSQMLGREDEMLQRASELKKTLESYKSIEAKQGLKKGVLAERRVTQGEIGEMRNEIDQLAEQSQEHHERMIMFYEETDKNRAKADEVHGRYVEKIKEADVIKQDLNFIMPQVYAMRDGLKASDLKVAELRKMNAKQRADVMKKEAVDKMGRGEKLSFEDLRLIYGDED
ncbi:hypothetical protein HN807_04120 [Candidatus Bathyarchaeota archaeon]|jgi:uncharacterized coiled-coil DUF342 family protein|nr:hypothetical protein [Candidatus Bathyarchaeota archaeon]MBT4321129.1 hypothetical protein [Candidatus Bathyarchaeota archaeon]MBT4424574.1 hypothetical protein [Candidatus Bathyarchaeota archaeon]MBT6604284.1 hypothetical protein [Candidatus Bathyarchaeota archaeon]MBT7187444.1 hypothetical protein [Candidatus Bathyarchaeota archaeon]